jgi:membrane protein YqaA with SNARE-associated domain
MEKIVAWLVSVLGTMGGAGIFLIALLDSSVLSLPVFNDLLVIWSSVANPARMPYYALMATLGSLGGSLLLYYLAKKGGEVMFRKHAGARAPKVRDWVQHNAFLSLALPCVFPPPMPFKAFVLAAGVFQVPLQTFLAALLVGRGLRYLGEGVLAVRYGAEATRYFLEHKVGFAAILSGLFVLSYIVTRLLFRGPVPHA